MAWRPCRVSLSVLPSPFPLPACLPACSSACRFVCLTAHCALRRTLRAEFSFSSSVQFGFSVPSVCEKTSGCLVVFRLSARFTFGSSVGSVRFDSSSSVGSPGSPFGLSNEFVSCGWKTLRTLKVSVYICVVASVCVSPYVCVCFSVCSKWKSASTAQLKTKFNLFLSYLFSCFFWSDSVSVLVRFGATKHCRRVLSFYRQRILGKKEEKYWMEVFVVVVEMWRNVHRPPHSLQIDRECGCHKGISGKIYTSSRSRSRSRFLMPHTNNVVNRNTL